MSLWMKRRQRYSSQPEKAWAFCFVEVEAGVTDTLAALLCCAANPFCHGGKGWQSKKKAWMSAQLFWTRLQQWELQIWWFLEISCEGQTFVLFNFSQTSKLWSCWIFSSSRLFSLIYLIFHPNSPMLSILKPLFFYIFILPATAHSFSLNSQGCFLLPLFYFSSESENYWSSHSFIFFLF